MSLRISIIIPFYNVQQYIAECLDNVYMQDIPEEEYEVICVNDASPDNARDIVLKYQKTHSNLILVEHEVNKKLGSARNTGLKIAQGEYIWHIDSDDAIAPNCLGTVLGICEGYNLDVLIFQHQTLLGSNIIENSKSVMLNMSTPLSGLDFWKMYSHHAVFSPVWNKVIRRSYLVTNGIFSPEINMGEDTPFSFETILRANRVLSNSRTFYLHREDSDSMSRAIRTAPSAEMVFENSFICGKFLHNVVMAIPRGEKSIIGSLKAIEKFILLQYETFLPIMSQSDISELKKLCRRNFCRNVYVIKIMWKVHAINYLHFVLSGRIK